MLVPWLVPKWSPENRHLVEARVICFSKTCVLLKWEHNFGFWLSETHNFTSARAFILPGAFRGRLPKGCFRISDIVSWLSRLFIFSRRFSSSFVVASLARTPCICIVLTKLGGMAGRGESGSLQLKQIPPRIGGRSPHREEPLAEQSRTVP